MTEARTSLPVTPLPGAALGDVGIVYFGNGWQAENRTSSHHVATRLAARTTVLYVDSPGMRAPDASSRDIGRALRKLFAMLRAPRHVADGLWHCTVPQLPLRRLPGVQHANRWFSRWAVRRAMRHVNIRRCISWFVVPHPGPLAGRLGEELVVYYCIDDYAAHPGVDEAAIGALDQALSKRADLLFVAPPALLAPKRMLNAHVVSAPHGVDTALFAQAQDPALQVADGARGLRAPVVGYIGSIHAWIDLPLVAWLARQRPQWSFLLVGHAHVSLDALQGLANVHLAGAQPYPSLPRWAKAFDVAIIPYRPTRQVANANPLKLREYLASGKPVVSARNPEIEKFADWVRIADDREGFLAELDAAIALDTPTLARARMAAVAGQSWDQRVADVVTHVEAALATRGSIAGMASLREEPA